MDVFEKCAFVIKLQLVLESIKLLRLFVIEKDLLIRRLRSNKHLNRLLNDWDWWKRSLNLLESLSELSFAQHFVLLILFLCDKDDVLHFLSVCHHFDEVLSLRLHNDTFWLVN